MKRAKRQKPAVVAFDPQPFLLKLGSGRTTKQYRAKQTVFSQGDTADAICYIERGKVKLTVVSARGKEAVISVLDAGSFFGEGCLVAQPLRLSSAVTVEPTTITAVARSTVVRLLQVEPEFVALFTAHLLTRNARIEADLVDHLFNSSEQRLARILLLMTQYGKELTPNTVVPRVSQETLAAMVGTTRSRVSHFMNRFRKLGFIQYQAGGGMQIHNGLLSVVLRE